MQHVGLGVSIRGARDAWAAGFANGRVTARGIAAARALGLETLVYTVNEPARMLELAALGAGGIFTDYPDRARTTLAGRPRLSSRAPSGGKLAATRVPIVSAAARAGGTSAVRPRSPSGSSILTRVTEPRKMCETTSPATPPFGGRAVRRRLEHDRLRPHEHEHALAARQAPGGVDAQPAAAVLDVAVVRDRRDRAGSSCR